MFVDGRQRLVPRLEADGGVHLKQDHQTGANVVLAGGTEVRVEEDAVGAELVPGVADGFVVDVHADDLSVGETVRQGDGFFAGGAAEGEDPLGGWLEFLDAVEEDGEPFRLRHVTHLEVAA